MLLLRLITLAGITAVGVNGLAPQRQVLISYSQDTSESNLDAYKNAITDAGGQVLHEFNLFKGFIAKASTQAIDTLRALSKEDEPTIEDDQTVTIQN